MSYDFYFIGVRPDLCRSFMPHLKLYTYPLPAAKMNSKTKIKIYKKVMEEVGKEYVGANEFVSNKINELCSEHGISTEEVRSYIFFK